jgi:hypothetical protein
MQVSLNELINGSLLGDASLRIVSNKYFYFKYTAKDENFLNWIECLFKQFSIKCWVIPDKKDKSVFQLGFYINTCPFPKLSLLRNLWYIKVNEKKYVKTIPCNLQLTSKILFFWYLGDGCLVRRKNDPNRVPPIVLATNNFSENEVEILIEKLRKLKLTFYKVSYKSGYTGKKSGHAIWSSTEDGTPFRFFRLVGLECPKEIVNCSTGRKGIYHEEKFFKNKWPMEEDWIKILSNVKEVGPILREKRLQLNLSQNQFGRKVGMRRENIRDVELSKRHFKVENFRKVLNSLDLKPEFLLNKLN